MKDELKRKGEENMTSYLYYKLQGFLSLYEYSTYRKLSKKDFLKRLKHGINWGKQGLTRAKMLYDFMEIG